MSSEVEALKQKLSQIRDHARGEPRNALNTLIPVLMHLLHGDALPALHVDLLNRELIVSGDQLDQNTAKIVPVFASLLANAANPTRETRERLAQLVGQAEELKHAAEASRAAAQNAAAAAAQSAGTAATADYAKTFATERRAHGDRASVLAAMIGTACVGWVSVWVWLSCTFLGDLKKYKNFGVWIPIGFRCLVLASIAGMVVWLMRLYRAERHNEIAFVQKLAAMNTFEAFAGIANKDPELKAAVVAHAMTTAFSPHGTSYGMSDNHESAMPTEAVLGAVGRALGKAARTSDGTGSSS